MLEYATDLFDRASVEALAGRLVRLLEAAVAEPERAIGSLDILAAEERAHASCAAWNDTARAIPPATLPELFAAQVARTPDAVAVVFERRAASAMRELDARANQLAHHLRGLGVGPEVVVGLCVERSPEMVVGLLGILKAGGAYLPLDPGYPPERLAFMLADAGAPVLVTQAALLDRLPAHGARIVLPRCRLAAPSRGSPPPRPPRARSAQPRLCHLHLGLDRHAERGRGRRIAALPTTSAWRSMRSRLGRTIGSAVHDRIGVRRLGLRDCCCRCSAARSVVVRCRPSMQSGILADLQRDRAARRHAPASCTPSHAGSALDQPALAKACGLAACWSAARRFAADVAQRSARHPRSPAHQSLRPDRDRRSCVSHDACR